MSTKLAVVHRREENRLVAAPASMQFSAEFKNGTQSGDSGRRLTTSPTSLWTEDLAHAERYQVALIPLPPFVDRVDKDAPAPLNLQSVLVLPLTWKDVVTHLRSHDPLRNARHDHETIIFGLNSVKLSSMEVRRAGTLVSLTALEFKLLRYLLLNPGRVTSRDELLNEVWGFDNYPCTRTVDTHVWRLRQKLETDPANPIHFHTVHAMGYKFVP